MAGTTPVHHSPYSLFQDQDTRGRSHSGRPHLTDDPSIIKFVESFFFFFSPKALLFPSIIATEASSS